MEQKIGYCEGKGRGCMTGSRVVTKYEDAWFCDRCYIHRKTIYPRVILDRAKRGDEM